MTLLVDDQLALLANLGAIELPGGIETPLVTVYSFQLRIAGAIVVPRTTDGVLGRLVATYLPAGADRAGLFASDGATVRVIDPTAHPAAVVKAKSQFNCNQLAAEVLAAAWATGAEIRLSPGNERGRLRTVLEQAELPFAVWEFVPAGNNLGVRERHAQD